MAQLDDIIDNDDIFEDDFDIIEIIDFGFPRRIFPRSNHFENLDELGFYRRFRMTKDTTWNLLVLIENEIEFPTDMYNRTNIIKSIGIQQCIFRNRSISPINQLLTCLRFYASNGHLQSVADFAGMHISTVSRIIVRVSRAIARLHNTYIKLPENEDEIRNNQRGFYEIASFPRVVGAIDGTHVKMQSPGGNEGEIFRNRKTYFSINVQAVCNANLYILDIVSRWPGSTHDSTIFNNSRVKARFEAGQFPNSILLGDSGYPLRNYFLTPLLNPNTRAQQLYNESHIRTRNTVESLFGIWKRRFPALAYRMRLKLETVLIIIVSTGVLHNFAKLHNEGDPPPAEGIDENELMQLIQLGQIPEIPLQNDNNDNKFYKK